MVAADTRFQSESDSSDTSSEGEYSSSTTSTTDEGDVESSSSGDSSSDASSQEDDDSSSEESSDGDDTSSEEQFSSEFNPREREYSTYGTSGKEGSASTHDSSEQDYSSMEEGESQPECFPDETTPEKVNRATWVRPMKWMAILLGLLALAAGSMAVGVFVISNGISTDDSSSSSSVDDEGDDTDLDPLEDTSPSTCPPVVTESTQNRGKCFATNAELRSAALAYNESQTIATYGPVRNWCVTHLSDFSGVFACNEDNVDCYDPQQNPLRFFNEPLDGWDMSNAVTLRGIFRSAHDFDQDLSCWKTSGVQDMSHAFRRASSFNHPLQTWDISSVEDMSGMFHATMMFNQPLNAWDTRSVTDLSGTFHATTMFNQPLDNWDTSAVTTLFATFSETQLFNQPLESWNTQAVVVMDQTFYQATAFNQPLNKWNTSLVVSFFDMFHGASTFNQDLCAFYNPNVATPSFQGTACPYTVASEHAYCHTCLDSSYPNLRLVYRGGQFAAEQSFEVQETISGATVLAQGSFSEDTEVEISSRLVEGRYQITFSDSWGDGFTAEAYASFQAYLGGTLIWQLNPSSTDSFSEQSYVFAVPYDGRITPEPTTTPSLFPTYTIPPTMEEADLKLVFKGGIYSYEQSFEVQNVTLGDGDTILSQGPFTSERSSQDLISLSEGIYRIVLRDSYGNGFSGEWGAYFHVFLRGQLIWELDYYSGSFQIETFDFAIPFEGRITPTMAPTTEDDLKMVYHGGSYAYEQSFQVQNATSGEQLLFRGSFSVDEEVEALLRLEEGSYEILFHDSYPDGFSGESDAFFQVYLGGTLIWNLHRNSHDESASFSVATFAFEIPFEGGTTSFGGI